jgi:NAD(P)-dependent dehydrogenase (short-subunit alcohol dehydrogenase family)
LSYFENKHAVVTGGGSGIGEAIAKALIDVGVTVTIMGRNPDKLAKAAEALGAKQQIADVTDRGQVRTAFAAAIEDSGPVDILINNAGAAEAVPFTRMSDDFWDQIIAVNLTGVYNCTRAVAEAMADARSGRIINIASVAALDGFAYISAYSAAKHGVLGMTRALSKEFATMGITVNAVCPGYVRTEIVENAVEKIMKSTGRTHDEAMAELVKMNPQGRLIEAEEVAETVIWLCQQESVNGQAIAITGGQ